MLEIIRLYYSYMKATLITMAMAAVTFFIYAGIHKVGVIVAIPLGILMFILGIVSTYGSLNLAMRKLPLRQSFRRLIVEDKTGAKASALLNIERLIYEIYTEDLEKLSKEERQRRLEFLNSEIKTLLVQLKQIEKYQRKSNEDTSENPTLIEPKGHSALGQIEQ